MKKIFCISLAVTAGLILGSCAAKNPENKPAAKTETAAPEIKVESKGPNPLLIPDSVYDSMLQKSIMNQGNNWRLKKLLEKIRNGENVYIAALGGSVTEGAGPTDFRDGYAYQFSKLLIKTYAPAGASNVYFDGAGLSGTSSVVGLVRYQQDVVDILGTDPDLLIIEFAVNDGTEPTKQRAFEELIRHALEAKPEAAVIALYSAAQYQNTQLQMSLIGNYYDIPQVSIQNAINNRQNSFSDSLFFTDNVHPTRDGHKIMAQALMNLIDIADKAPADSQYVIPSEYKLERSLKGFKQISGDDENVSIKAGDFNSTDSGTQGLKKTNKGDFPNNWQHKMESGNTPFRMEITCRNLILVHKDYGNWGNEVGGKADVYVDGKFFQTLDGNSGKGWNNCLETILIDSDSSAKHTIEIKMAQDNQDKAFTICAMGYTK